MSEKQLGSGLCIIRIRRKLFFIIRQPGLWISVCTENERPVFKIPCLPIFPADHIKSQLSVFSRFKVTVKIHNAQEGN